jgi:hypothetical protein
VQDPAIDVVRVAPFRRLVADMLRAPLSAAVEEEGYALVMSVDDAVQFLLVVLTGFLSSRRFDQTFGLVRAHLHASSARRIGVPDAEGIVLDVPGGSASSRLRIGCPPVLRSLTGV